MGTVTQSVHACTDPADCPHLLENGDCPHYNVTGRPFLMES